MDSFLEACGATESLRLEIEGPRPGRVRTRMLLHPFALVGRDPSADVPLRHAQVSLRHAYIQCIAGRLACFELGGRGGIQWPDGRPARAGWLDPARSIQIGPFALRRVIPGPAPTAAENPWVASNPMNLRWEEGGPEVILEFPDQSRSAPSRWRMSRVVTLVGRAPGCRVRLPDVNVSWYHCSLVRTPHGVWVVDLMSRVGVRVNGVAVRYGRVENGDELQVGPFRIVLRAASDRPRASAGRTHRAAPIAPAEFSPVLVTAADATSLPDAWPALRDASNMPALDEPLEAELVEFLNTPRGGGPVLVRLIEQFARMQQQMIEQFNQSLLALMQHMGERHRDQMTIVQAEIAALRKLSDELLALRDQMRARKPAALPGPMQKLKPPPREETTPPVPAAAGEHDPDSDERLAAARRAPAPAPAPAEDPLVMVTRRIAEIRGEQRGRWQKILDLVRARS